MDRNVAKTESDVSPMNSAHRASQLPAKPPRWNKLVPVGTDIPEGSVDLAPLPLTLVHQGRWTTGGQLNSGHLLLQDDQTDRYISACWTSAAQFQPTASCSHTYTNAHSLSLLGATNVQG